MNTGLNHPHILLYNVRPDTEQFIRNALTAQTCEVKSIAASESGLLDPNEEYCLIFAEMNFHDQTGLQQLYSLRNRMSRCMTIFVFHESRQELIKASYIIGDGAIIFPMDKDKFNRILNWYISTGETRCMETFKEKRRRKGSGMMSALNANKGLILILLAATLLLGAIIGLFFADRVEKTANSGVSARENPSKAELEKLKGVLNELRK